MRRADVYDKCIVRKHIDGVNDYQEYKLTPEMVDAIIDCAIEEAEAMFLNDVDGSIKTEDEGKWVEALKACHGMGTDDGHIQADEILCALLRSLGYHKVVKTYDDVAKWYA